MNIRTYPHVGNLNVQLLPPMLRRFAILCSGDYFGNKINTAEAYSLPRKLRFLRAIQLSRKHTIQLQFLVINLQLQQLYLFVKGGGPDWIRTSGPQFRKLMLYPTELRDLSGILIVCNTPKRKGPDF